MYACTYMCMYMYALLASVLLVPLPSVLEHQEASLVMPAQSPRDRLALLPIHDKVPPVGIVLNNTRAWRLPLLQEVVALADSKAPELRAVCRQL